MADTVKLDILAHADFSARIKRTKRTPGYGVFATQVDQLRNQNPDGTLLLDAGDESSSKFWAGEPMVGAIALLKTDAMTLGNHEFDRGMDYVHSFVAKAPFPVLCANVTEKATGKQITGTNPWVILEKQGIKIGILGITTEYTPFMVTAPMFDDFEMHPCAEACQTYIPKMRKAGAQIIVVLAHIPFYIEENGGISGELYDMIQASPSADAFIGGHIPGDYAGIVHGAAVVKGGFAGESLCHIQFEVNKGTGSIAQKSAAVLLTDWSLAPLKQYAQREEQIVGPYREYFERVLATLPEQWDFHMSAESRLGDFLADAMRFGGGTQIAYMNATSATGPLYAGTVTAEDINAVMGFNDPICTASITGEQLYRLFEIVYEPERFGNNAGLLYSGIIIHADHTRPAFHKILSITLSDETPIDRDTSYTVSTSLYMSSGGNGTAKIAKELQWVNTQRHIHDAIFDYIEHDGLTLTVGQRLYEIGRPENDNSPE